MLPSALESAGWGSERCGTKRSLGGRGKMREGDRSLARRFGRVVRGLRRRGRRGRRRRRSRRVGGGWTGRVSRVIHYFDILERGRTLISPVKTGSKSSNLLSKNGYIPMEHLQLALPFSILSLTSFTGYAAHRFLPFGLPQCLDRFMMWGCLVDAIAYGVIHFNCRSIGQTAEKRVNEQTSFCARNICDLSPYISPIHSNIR